MVESDLRCNTILKITLHYKIICSPSIQSTVCQKLYPLYKIRKGDTAIENLTTIQEIVERLKSLLLEQQRTVLDFILYQF